jgi:type I restriction enzyme R subunit
MKTYEADMRHLIDNYIQADDSKVISPFGDLSLIEIIVNSGIADAINRLPQGIKSNQQAVSETIENNVRQKIIRDHLLDPAFFEEMSTLLNAIIKERRDNAISYEAYLKKIAEIAKKVQLGILSTTPVALKTPAQRALYNNLDKNEELALNLHESIIEYKPNGWRGIDTREKVVKQAIYRVLNDFDETERIFDIVKKQSEY